MSIAALAIAAPLLLACPQEEPAHDPNVPIIHADWELVAIAPESDFEACGVADVDRDGDLDIICGDAWYAAPEWTRHEIGLVRSVGGYRVDFADLPLDVDGDGWIDVVSCSWHDRGVFWRRNPGDQGGPWKMTVVDQPGNMETAILADVDQDGSLDVLPNIIDKVVWYSVENGELKRHDVDTTRGGHGIGLGDVNGDGRADLVGPNGWWQAPEDRRHGDWTFHPEWSLGGAGISIVVRDVDGDGDADIFWGMGHDYGIAWLEQSTNDDDTRRWIRHDIEKTWSQAHGLVTADLDGDGRIEVVTGKRRYAHNGHDPGGEDDLIVCTYEWDAATGRFIREVLSTGGRVGAGQYPVVVDLDGDADLDIVLPGKSGLWVLRSRHSERWPTPSRTVPVGNGAALDLIPADPESAGADRLDRLRLRQADGTIRSWDAGWGRIEHLLCVGEDAGNPDLNGDGLPDVFLQLHPGGRFSDAWLALGRADGTAGVIGPLEFSDCQPMPSEKPGGFRLTIGDGWFESDFPGRLPRWPRVVYRIDGERLVADPDAMRSPPPDRVTYASMVKDCSRINPDSNDRMFAESGHPGESGFLLTTVLELVYQGHADIAWRLAHDAWPEDAPGLDRWLAMVRAKLSSSPTAELILQLNGLSDFEP